MKNFLNKILFFCLILSGILVIGAFIPLSKCFEDTYLAAQLDKDARLSNNIKTQKLIIVGGSNAAFGINTKLLEDSLKMKSYNQALHAGLGLNYMCQNVKEFIVEGDVVLMSIEYEQFYGKYSHGEDILADLIMNTDPIKALNLPLFQFFFQVSNLAKSTIKKFTHFKCEDDGLYSRSNFNEYGDFIGHNGIVKTNTIEPYSLENLKINKSVFSELVDFKNDLINRGVNLVITFPSLQEESYFNSLTEINEVYLQFNSCNFTLLDKPIDHVYGNECFFDSPYHLNSSYKNIRTLKIIEKLKQIK